MTEGARPAHRGIFVSFEGGDGVGKSTQLGLLAEWVRARGREVVTQQGWEAIDALERARGGEHGRPRIKLCTWDDLLTAARG